MSAHLDAIVKRDSVLHSVRIACEREIERARKEARIADACDITPGYEPNLKAIKSTLRARKA